MSIRDIDKRTVSKRRRCMLTEYREMDSCNSSFGCCDGDGDRQIRGDCRQKGFDDDRIIFDFSNFVK